MEYIKGDYIEFGMFEGTSLIIGLECHLKTRQENGPIRKFWGLDSFEGGFKYSTEEDIHPFWKPGDFKSVYSKVEKRIRKYFNKRAEWEIIPGFFEESIAGKNAREFGIKNIALALIDCDLGSPSKIALDFIKPALHEGSIIILDDYFAYKGSLTKGEAGAFEEFKIKYPELNFRRIFDYGLGGRGFILVNEPF